MSCARTGSVGLVVRRQPALHPPRDHIMPEVQPPAEERLDVLDRRIHLAPVLLVFFFLRAVPLGSGFLAFLFGFLFTHK